MGKIIYQYSLEGEFVKEWDSASTIGKQLGCSAINIRACIRRNLFITDNMIWLPKRDDLLAKQIVESLKPKNLNGEEWKDIPGYEGSYQISNMGRVKALSRIVKYNGIGKGGGTHNYPERILKNMIIQGYEKISLTKNNKPKGEFVHRLVAEAFCEKTPGAYFVNHINGIKTDNVYTNLEWVTSSQNVRHALMTGLSNPYGENNCRAKITNIQAELIRIFRRTYRVPANLLAEFIGVHVSSIKRLCSEKSFNPDNKPTKYK